jgi:hypothetical protein
MSMIRRVRKAIPAAALAALIGDDYDTAGMKPACAWNDPDARNELVTRLVNDALALLDAVDGAELDDDQAQLIGLLALVAGQDVEPDPNGPAGSWRIETGVTKHRVISTVDPESRHMHKSRSVYRDGYKAHVAVEPETGIITGCDLTPANEGDGPTGVELLADEPAGTQVLADSAYGSGDTLAAIDDADHDPVIKPWPLRLNANLGADQFNRDDFTIDYAARTVTCPNGVTTHITDAGTATFKAKCRDCPLRHRCTTAVHGRTFHVGEHDQLLAANRARWRNDPDLVAAYRQHRPLVERTIAWLVANGNRRVRFIGADTNRLGLTHRAAALNLRRLLNLGLEHNGQSWTLA